MALAGNRRAGSALCMEAAHRLGSTLDKSALVERLARVVADNLGRPDFAVYLVKEAEDKDQRQALPKAAIQDSVE